MLRCGKETPLRLIVEVRGGKSPLIRKRRSEKVYNKYRSRYYKPWRNLSS